MFLVSAIAALIIVPQTDIAKTFLLKQARIFIGQDLRVKHVDLAVLPHPSLQLFEVEMKNVDPSLELLKIQYLDVEIALLPLLLRTVVFKRLILEQPRVIIRLLDKNTTSPAGPPDISPVTSKPPSFTIPFIEKISIRNGHLTLRKTGGSRGVKDLVIEDILITSSTPASSLSTKVQVAAKSFNSEKVPLSLEFSGDIDQFSPQNVSQEPRWGNLPPLEIAGQMEVSNFHFAEIEEFFALGTGLEEIQSPINLNTQLTLFPDISGVSIVVSDLQGNLGSIPVRGKGSVSGLWGNETTFFTWFSSSSISIRALNSVIPASLVSSDVQKILEEHEIDGEVELIATTIAGSTANDIGISVMEEVRISQGHLLLNTHLPPVNNIGGTIIWNNGELRLINVTGEYQSTKIVDGEAHIQFRESGPWATFNLESEVDVQNLLQTWTVVTPAQELPATLHDVQATGTISVKGHGPLEEPEKIVIDAIHLRDGNLLLSENLQPITHVTGTASLKKNHLRLTNLHANYGSSKILSAQSTIQFQEKSPRVKLEARTHLNVQDVRSLIGHLSPTLEIPKTLESLEGQGNLTFSLEGPVNQHQKVVLKNVRLEKGRFRLHPDLPPLDQVSGTASLHNSTLRLVDVNAVFRSSHIRDTTATIQFREQESWIDMAIHSNLAAKDVMELLGQLDPAPEALLPVVELTEVSGGGQVVAAIQGPLSAPEQWTLSSGEIHLDDIRFLSPMVSAPVEKLSGNFMISEEELSIVDFSGQIGKSQAKLQGTIGLGETQTFRDVVLNGQVESVDINKIHPGLVPDALQGPIQLNAVVSGDRDSPNFTVHADLKDVQLDFPDVIHKPAGMPASFETGGKIQNQMTIILEHADLELPHLYFSGKGTFNIGDPFAIAATVETAPVSLVSLPEKMLFGIKKFKSGDLSLALDVNGSGNDWRGWQINGSANLKDMVEVTDSPESPRSNLSIELRLDQERGELNFTLEAIPAKNLTALADITESKLEGPLWMKGTLQGRVEPNKDPIPTLKGKVHLSVQEGTIHPGKALSRILSYINLPSLIKGDVQFDQNTLPFTSFTGDIDVENGILHTENLVLHSPVLMVSTMGDHDLVADRVDLVVAASPLDSYTKILKDIPLVNKLFGGGEEQLLTVFFEVKGATQDPSVRPLPFKSVKEQAKVLIDLSVNTLNNAVSLPKEVLKSSPKKQDPSSQSVD